MTPLSFAKIQSRFDLAHGGFGDAPKFPDLLPIRFLLNHAHFTEEEPAREHAFFSAVEGLRVSKAALGNNAGFIGAGLLGEYNNKG